MDPSFILVVLVWAIGSGATILFSVWQQNRLKEFATRHGLFDYFRRTKLADRIQERIQGFLIQDYGRA